MVVSATVRQVGEPLAVQADDRLSAPIAGVTVENYRRTSITEFSRTVNDLIQGNIVRSLHVACRKFLWSSDIHNKRTLIDQLLKTLRRGYTGGAKKLHSENPESNQHHRDNDNYRVIVHGR